jgi:hypothetical protein
MMNCAAGGVCVPLQSGGRACFEPCDPQMPMCSSGSCQSFGLDFGVCAGG